MYWILLVVLLLFLYRPLKFTVKPYTEKVYNLSIPLLEKKANYSTFKKTIPKMDSVVHRDMVQLYRGGNFTVNSLDRILN